MSKFFLLMIALFPAIVYPDSGLFERLQLRKKVVRASSVLIEKGKPDDFYAPEKALDGSKDSAWCAAGKSGGIGEWIEINFEPTQSQEHSGPSEAREDIFVLPGITRNRQLHFQNNRIKDYRVELVFSTGRMEKISGRFEDNVCAKNSHCKILGSRAPDFDTRRCLENCNSDGFAVPIKGRRLNHLQSIRLTILSVYPGSRFRDTCISEIIPALHADYFFEMAPD